MTDFYREMISWEKANEKLRAENEKLRDWQRRALTHVKTAYYMTKKPNNS